MLDDITRSATFYVAQMHRHLKACGYSCPTRPFNFTQELCLALNNVEFVREQINPLPNELGFETVSGRVCEGSTDRIVIECMLIRNSRGIICLWLSRTTLKSSLLYATVPVQRSV